MEEVNSKWGAEPLVLYKSVWGGGGGVGGGAAPPPPPPGKGVLNAITHSPEGESVLSHLSHPPKGTFQNLT